MKNQSTKKTIQEELNRVESALRANQKKGKLWCQLYAAQQALAWALDHAGFASPTKTILETGIRPV